MRFCTQWSPHGASVYTSFLKSFVLCHFVNSYATNNTGFVMQTLSVFIIDLHTMLFLFYARKYIWGIQSLKRGTGSFLFNHQDKGRNKVFAIEDRHHSQWRPGEKYCVDAGDSQRAKEDLFFHEFHHTPRKSSAQSSNSCLNATIGAARTRGSATRRCNTSVQMVDYRHRTT